MQYGSVVVVDSFSPNIPTFHASAFEISYSMIPDR